MHFVAKTAMSLMSSVLTTGVKCSSCEAQAIYLARYNGQHYCKSHFCEFVENRVKKEIREQRIFDRGGRIAVAVSGGKDSMTTLHLLRLLSSARRGTEIIAITVDEGISGYRDESMKLVGDYCESNGIQWFTRSYADFAGFTMDALAAAERERTTCAYCGVFRRTLINALAKETCSDVLATGLNLDDTAQSILMNLARGDSDRFAMMGPHEANVEGLVPRVQPLRQLPENEVMLYAEIRNIPYLRSTCPYSEEASRNLFREIVLRIEDEMPGSRYAMLRTISKMHKTRTGGSARRCSECGDTTSSEVCRACALRLEASRLTGTAQSS